MRMSDAIARLRECQANPDYENAHGMADDVLCEMLTDLGFGEVVTEYKKVRRLCA